MEAAPVLAALAIIGAACTGCSTTRVRLPDTTPARIVLVGDVMLGRGVGSVVANDPGSVFEGLRPTLADADLALGNLESPLTTRPHIIGAEGARADGAGSGGGEDNVLEADPAAAALLRGAGFDGMAIANNHAGDAGPETVTDTITALSANDLAVVGGGANLAAATAATTFVRNGVRIAVLAFDLTGGGPAAGDGPGVARWDEAVARAAVSSARASADIVIVGVHGGVEYLPRPDPVLRSVVADLTAWGVDVVWGTGAHVPFPVTVAEQPDGRPSVQAPGLGNALFDQQIEGTDTGLALEVLVDAHGVRAWRTGRVATRLRAWFMGWDEPAGDAVSLDGEWWTPTAMIEPVDAAAGPAVVAGLPAQAVLVTSGRGDIDGDGVADVVASYRRPWRPRLLHEAYPDVDFTDADERTAHLGVFARDGTLRWGAGTMLQPVATLAACDGAVALAFSGLDDPVVASSGAWTWRGFGFATNPVLAGPARTACADVDGDGRTEPLLVRSHSSTTGAS